MNTKLNLEICRSCGSQVETHYCGNCGEQKELKRISIHGLVHDVFHFFTHLDKGFLYTLKQLVKAPGNMQLDYVNGERSKHQKPFSMFFICATFYMLSKYYINKIMIYYQIGEIKEADFSHKYMVPIQILLIPFYALLAYLFFRKSKFNYAETGVMLIYTVSFFFIFTTFILLIKFIAPEFDTGIIEFPILMLYNGITFLNFYKGQPKWSTALKSIIIFSIVAFLVRMIEKFGTELMGN